MTVQAPPSQDRMDGFFNVLSGLGAPGIDRTMGTGYAGRPRGGLSRHWASRYALLDLTDLYLTRGVAAKIIDRPADDSMARGVEIEGDGEGLMTGEFDRLAVLSRMADALRWARLYGGSAIMLLAKDGKGLEDPLDVNNLDQIVELRVIDAGIIRTTTHLYQDPLNPAYGKPEIYDIQPPGLSKFSIHESRLIPIGADPLPHSFLGAGSLWWTGRSALEGTIADLMRYEQGLEWALRLLERKQQGIYSMEGLGEMFAQGDDAIVTRRINLVDMVRSNLNSIVIDKNDAYAIENLSLDGLQSLIQEFQVALSAASDIPVVVLFGKSSTGLNATGAGDLENYYSLLGRIQNRNARPALERLISILWMQSHLKTKIPETWKLTFNAPWVPSAKEQAETAAAEATAKAAEVSSLIALVMNQILMPEEARAVVLTRYSEYGFDDSPDSSGGDADYAGDVSDGGAS